MAVMINAAPDIKTSYDRNITLTIKDIKGPACANDGQRFSVVEFSVLVLRCIWLVVSV